MLLEASRRDSQADEGFGMKTLKTIGWAYNWEVSDELVDAYYVKERRR